MKESKKNKKLRKAWRKYTIGEEKAMKYKDRVWERYKKTEDKIERRYRETK